MKEEFVNRITNKIKGYIRDHKILYSLAMGIKGGISEERYELLRGYYDYRTDVSTIIVLHLGELNLGRAIYCFRVGDDNKHTSGFCALLRNSLISVNYAERLGMIPVVKWGEHTSYYDQGMDNKTRNVFDYYFKPVSDVSYQEVEKSQNVVYSTSIHVMCLEKQFKRPLHNQYLAGEEEIVWIGGLYKKYIRLNDETRDYIKEEVKRCLGGKRTLGIHIRGTDFKRGFAAHPVFIKPEDYLKKAKALLEVKKYEQIFLATDDLDALRIFQDEVLPDQFVYYEDVLRGEGRMNPMAMESDRPLHHYKLGLEVLRDVYTLALCDGLIAGLSQVSFAARYVNYALDRHFDDLIILNHGVNEKGPISGKAR